MQNGGYNSSIGLRDASNQNITLVQDGFSGAHSGGYSYEVPRRRIFYHIPQGVNYNTIVFAGSYATSAYPTAITVESIKLFKDV